MIKSMTGFGRANVENENFTFTIEIKAVNHRYLDLNIRMPRALISLEDKVRKTLQKELNRGKIDLFITKEDRNTSSEVVNLNKKLAAGYIETLKELGKEFSLKDDLSISLISKFPDVITVNHKEENLEEIWNSLDNALNVALKNLILMREQEGARLKEDIINKIASIKASIEHVEELAPLTVKNYKVRLQERISELLDDNKVDDIRIAQEIAIFSDRAAIDEEIVRLKSHIYQVKETLNLEEPIGRKLDFVIQEMNRETNTISSKANNIDITNLTISIKNEIEKIREQVQNIE